MAGDSYMPKGATPVTEPQGFDYTNLIPLALSLGGGVLGTAIAPGLGSYAGYGGGAALGEAIRQKLKGEDFNLGQIGMQGALGAVPLKFGIQGAKYLPKLLNPRGGAFLNPKALIGQLIEKKVASVKTPVPNELFEKYFGTAVKPKPELYQGLSGTSGQQSLIQKLKNEIVTQGRAGENIPNPSYLDVLNNRIGSYLQAKPAFQQFGPFRLSKGATPENLLSGRIGGAYSNILKEGAGTGGLDTAYGMLSKLYTAAKIGAPSYFILDQLKNLLNKDKGY